MLQKIIRDLRTVILNIFLPSNYLLQMLNNIHEPDNIYEEDLCK